MIRLMGTILIATCCVLSGNLASRQLSNHVELLESALSFWRAVRSELSFSRASPGWIFEALQERRPEFARLSFFERSISLCKQGKSFPDAFSQGLTLTRSQWTEREYQLLRDAGALLGSTSLESQLQGLDYACKQLEELLEEAKDYRKRHVGLYHSLGVTAGAAVFILLL